MFRETVPCDGKNCRPGGGPHTHHLTRYGVFWWRTFGLHRGRLPKRSG